MTKTIASSAPIDPSVSPNRTKFLIFGIMAFGQFMALIDIQIVAASLNNVQAGCRSASMKPAVCRPPIWWPNW